MNAATTAIGMMIFPEFAAIRIPNIVLILPIVILYAIVGRKRNEHD